MKHLLPILTLALLGAASIASAAPTYTEETFINSDYDSNYSFYVNPEVSTDGNVQTIDYGKYQVVKYGGSWGGALMYSNYFRIHANENVDFYLYDFVDNVQSSDNSANALTGVNAEQNKRAVQYIGYRETKAITDSEGKITGFETSNEKTHPIGDPTSVESVQRQPEGEDAQPYEIVRNSYYLGRFEAGKDYELYVSYETDGSDGVWSNTGDMAAGYHLYTVDEDNNAMIPKSNIVPVDKLMWAYKNGSFSSAGMLYMAVKEKDFESANAMPIAQLNNVYFGMRAVGSPLPGGLPIALVAGLFGLGFWYIRRRKNIAC